MYVYVWKDPHGVPFYVGIGSTIGRSNPNRKSHRNKHCLQKLKEIGADKVIVEIRNTPNEDAAKLLEQQLIQQYGRIREGGTLTNISKGGEFHSATPETRQKLKKLWEDPSHRTKVLSARTGVKRNLSEITKKLLRERVLENPNMKPWGERNGKDSEFDAKRIAGIRAAQGRRREKMSDPEALAKRKERLKATLNSEAYKAKRAQRDTPEYRAKLSAAKRAYWEKRKSNS